jgi:hypothetical protein
VSKCVGAVIGVSRLAVRVRAPGQTCVGLRQAPLATIEKIEKEREAKSAAPDTGEVGSDEAP